MDAGLGLEVSNKQHDHGFSALFLEAKSLGVWAEACVIVSH